MSHRGLVRLAFPTCRIRQATARVTVHTSCEMEYIDPSRVPDSSSSLHCTRYLTSSIPYIFPVSLSRTFTAYHHLIRLATHTLSFIAVAITTTTIHPLFYFIFGIFSQSYRNPMAMSLSPATPQLRSPSFISIASSTGSSSIRKLPSKERSRMRRDFADNWPFPREMRRMHSSREIPFPSSLPQRKRTIRRKQGCLHLRDRYKTSAAEVQSMLSWGPGLGSRSEV